MASKTDRNDLVIVRFRAEDFRRFRAEAERHRLMPTEAARALIFGVPKAVRDRVLGAAARAAEEARADVGGDHSPSVRARAVDAGARAAQLAADPMASAEARAAEVDERAALLVAQIDRLVAELTERRRAVTEAAPAAPAEAGGAA